MDLSELVSRFRKAYVEDVEKLVTASELKQKKLSIPTEDLMTPATLAVYETKTLPRNYAWFAGFVFVYTPPTAADDAYQAPSTHNMFNNVAFTERAAREYRKWVLDCDSRNSQSVVMYNADFENVVLKVKSMNTLQWVRDECQDPAVKANWLLKLRDTKKLKLTREDRSAIRAGVAAIFYRPGYPLHLLPALVEELKAPTVAAFDDPDW